ncbi:iron ABC transporter permease [Candidatus Acetothermia bacterium]|nr:iron ABC transporter permease [Candidatus Acetothermia bacterium]
MAMHEKALAHQVGALAGIWSWLQGRVIGNRPWRLWIPAVLIATAMAAPLVVLVMKGAQVAPDLWTRLVATRVPSLFVNTMALAGLVTLGSLLIGFLLAWLVERTDLPGRRFFRPMLLSPLAVPCYVLAICYVEFFGINGLLEKSFLLIGIDVNVFSIYGLGGSAFVLTLACYPFVYAIARSAIKQLDPKLVDAARCSGASRWMIARKIILPLLFPALSAGVILSSVYALSDFGVVTKLRFDTFVKVIYQQMNGTISVDGAVALGTVLVLLAFIFLWLQGIVWGKKRYAPEKLSGRTPEPLQLGVLKIPALILAGVVLLVGLVLPVGILLYWWIGSLVQPQAIAALWGTSAWDLFANLLNSFSISAIAAIAAVILALPLAYAFVRKQDRISRITNWLAQAGQALPGVLIALGVLMVMLNVVPFLYATLIAVIFAYIVRFFPQALQSLRSGLTQIPGRLEEGARLLGDSPLRAFRRVTLPLLKPALLGGWMLVFLSALRELPATMVLRPAGFNTLPVRIWTAAAEGFYAQAAPAALLLVVISIPMLIWLHSERTQHPENIQLYE